MYYVGIGIGVVVATTAHLLLRGLQEREHGCLAVELGIDGERLHEHSDGAAEGFVLAAVEDGGEERLLFVVELSQEKSVGSGEESAAEDACAMTELVDGSRAHAEHPHEAVFAMVSLFEVGQQLGERVGAVEVLCIPALALVEGLARTGLLLYQHLLGERAHFRFDRLAAIGTVYIVEHQVHGSAVDDDVVVVDKEIVLSAIVEEAYAEEAVAHEVERLHELRLHLLEIVDALYLDGESLRSIDLLNGLAVVVETDASEQGRVKAHGRFYCAAKTPGIEAVVNDINVR